MMTDRDWFHPRRYGYGAGLPASRAGWLVTALYAAAIVGIAIASKNGIFDPVQTAVLIGSVTLSFALIASRRTRGGWKWRWGDHDQP